jgi:hypothetical protein
MADQWMIDFPQSGPQFVPNARGFTIFKVPTPLLERKSPDDDYFEVHMLQLGLHNRTPTPDTREKVKVQNLKLQTASVLHHKLVSSPPPSITSWDEFAKVVVADVDLARRQYEGPVPMSDAGVQNHLALDALFIIFYFQYFNSCKFNIKEFAALAEENAATLKSIGVMDFLLVENQVPMYILKNVVRELCKIDDDLTAKQSAKPLEWLVEDELNSVLFLAVWNLIPLSSPTIVRPIAFAVAKAKMVARLRRYVFETGASLMQWACGKKEVCEGKLYAYLREYYPPHAPHALENCKHLLHCVYRVVCGHVQPPYMWDMAQLDNPSLESIPSAAQLDEMGIMAESSMQCTGNSVELSHGWRTWLFSARLKLPKVEFNDYTARHFRNLALYEQLMGQDSNQYNSDLRCFLVCMHDLCKESADLELLRTRGLISVHVRIDDGVSMWDKILRGIEGPTPSDAWLKCYNDVHRHCRSGWKRWRRRNCGMFFNQPWKGLSILAAIILLALTALQTWFTVVNSASSKGKWP